MSPQHDIFASCSAIPKNSDRGLEEAPPRPETLTVCKTVELLTGLRNRY